MKATSRATWNGYVYQRRSKNGSMGAQTRERGKGSGTSHMMVSTATKREIACRRGRKSVSETGRRGNACRGTEKGAIG
jgi:ketosteroid isomerase-like protein